MSEGSNKPIPAAPALAGAASLKPALHINELVTRLTAASGLCMGQRWRDSAVAIQDAIDILRAMPYGERVHEALTKPDAQRDDALLAACLTFLAIDGNDARKARQTVMVNECVMTRADLIAELGARGIQPAPIGSAGNAARVRNIIEKKFGPAMAAPRKDVYAGTNSIFNVADTGTHDDGDETTRG